VSVTLVHIPVLIGIFIVKPKYSWLIALSFGLSSLIASYMYATNPVDLAFRNPLISVVPRVLFGFAAWGIFVGLQLLSKLRHGKFVIFGVVSLVTIFALYYGSHVIADIFAVT